ncbi:neprilysin-2-like isoform X2 [Dermacentor albipictus]|uniref:neprilysin-2-like isoform X2 n=1 Tax=Dermacentor albipictus TaxID=60249 RepID=UPI0038FC08A9
MRRTTEVLTKFATKFLAIASVNEAYRCCSLFSRKNSGGGGTMRVMWSILSQTSSLTAWSGQEEHEPCSLDNRDGHMSTISLLALFTIAIVVIGILLYIAARRTTARPRSGKVRVKACTNADCLRHAAAIKMAWNTSVHPCDDFYSFVCGSWAAEKSHRRMDDLTVAAKQIAFAELLSHRPAPGKARKFFLSCINAAADVQSNLDVLKTWASSMGMIQPRAQSQAQAVNRHPLDLLLDLAINWRMGPLSVQATVHPGRNQWVLILKPVLGVWRALLDGEDFMFLVDQHVTLLDAQRPSSWLQWNETVAALRAATSGTIVTSASDEVACVVAGLDDLTRWLPRGVWLDFINAHFRPELTFDESDPVIVYETPAMVNIGNVFKPRRLNTLSEVFSWLVLETYLGVIVTQYKARDTVDKAWSTEHNCLSHTSSSLGLLSVRRYLQRKFPSWRRQSVDTFLKHVRTTWALNVEDAPWIDEDSTRSTLKKVRALKTILWPGDEFFDRQSSEALYGIFPDMDKPFAANLIETALALRRLVNNSLYADVYTKQFADGSDAVAYKYHLNEAHIALAALNPPVYYDVEMFAMAYGGLGSLYAKEVSKMYDSIGRSLDANGELRAGAFNEELPEYKEKFRCNITSRFPFYEYFIHISGLETAFESYNVAVSRDSWNYDYRLETLGEYSSDQVFFMTYCHILCAPRTDYSAEQYCNVPLGNFKPFAEAFRCPVGSYMNPEKKCPLFVAEKGHDGGDSWLHSGSIL